MIRLGAALLPALLLAASAATEKSSIRFSDVTEDSGIPPLKYGEGVCFRDLDGDGLPELFLPNVKGRDRLFGNLGSRRFGDVTEARGVRGTGGIGAVFGDMDGDGLEDLYVVRGAYPFGENVLYRHGKDGIFRDVTEEAGVAARRNGITAVLADVDGDGRPDLFVVNWGRNTLYGNRSVPGRIRFEDATQAAGLSEEGRSWSAVFTDLNGDGHPDLVVARGGAGKPEGVKVYVNRGNGTFEDRTDASGVRGVSWSLAVISADFDGDGDVDLFVTGYDGLDRLFRNDGKGRFTDVTEDSGIRTGHSVGAAAGDVDGDLLPDLVVAGFQGPVTVYGNLGGMRFARAGDTGIGEWKRNEGVALADIDDDGDLDLYVANYDGHNRLYRNLLDGRNFLKVRLDGGGRTMIGAVARLYKSERIGNRGDLLATQELQSGFGFCSQSPEEFLFRLPVGMECDLRVTLPGGKRLDRAGVGPGRLTLRVERGGN